MESSRSLVNDHGFPALGLMLASIFWASFIPVAVVMLDPREFPFLFNATWRLGSSLFCALGFFIYAIRLGPGWLPQLWSLRRRFASWPVLFLTLGSMEYGLFALVIRHISPPVASVLLESYVLPGVLLVLLGLRGRYSDSPFLLAFLLPFSLLGVVFLTASEYGGFREVFSGVLVGRVGPLWGVGISLVAALILALGFLVFRWSEEVGLELSRMEGGSERRRELVVLALFASLVICNVLSVPLSLGVGLMLGGSFPRPGLVALMLLVGFVVHGPPVLGWRLGVMLSRYAGIGVLIHVSTLLTLGWYWLLSLAAVSHPGYLAVGVLMVVGSGALAQVQGWVSGLLRWPFRLGGRLLR